MARPAKTEVLCTLVAKNWSRGRHRLWLLLLCRLYVLVVYIIGVVIVDGIYRMVDVVADLFLCIIVPQLLAPFPLLRLAVQCKTCWYRGIRGTSRDS